MTYKEQLLDPRWQKKRLEILNRDNFSCTKCGDTNSTLHVHHNKYSKYPWDIDNDFLETLCVHCHLIAEDLKAENCNILNSIKTVSQKGDILLLINYTSISLEKYVCIYIFNKDNASYNKKLIFPIEIIEDLIVYQETC